jgi:RluA family pseudouridine synthase
MKKQTHRKARLQVLLSGKGWLAVDKPAGMSVHNEPGRDLYAQVALLLQAQPALRKATGLNAGDHLHAVHRLDRETSGVILLAGNRSVLGHFAAQFEARTVDKRYAAIVHGRLPETEKPDAWHAWKWSLTNTPGGRKNPRGKGPRKACTTLVRTLGHSEHYTLVECKLLTGRKHQIRRHARQAGHFVVGDSRYGSKRALNFLRNNLKFKRLGLHAFRLEIVLPDGSPAVIRSKGLPTDMQRLLDGDGYVPVSGAVEGI